MKKILFFCLLAITAQAQLKLGNNIGTINANSVLELEHTTKGMLLPRVSLTSTTSYSPLSATIVAGFMVYNTNAAVSAGSSSYPINSGGTGLYYWDGSGWVAVRQSFDSYTPSQSGNSGKFLTTNGTNTSWGTPSASVADGDKGDISVTGSGATWTIDNNAISTAKVADDAITYAKIQNVATNQRLLGRTSGANGNIEELSKSATLDWIGSTRGSVLYRGSSGWAVLTPGSSGAILKSNGSGADPSWASTGINFYPPVSTGGVAAGTTQGTALALSTAYGNFLMMSTVSSGTGVKLATAFNGYWIIIKNNGANTLNIYPDTGLTINSLSANTAITLAAGSSVMIIGVSSSNYQTISLP